MKKTRVFFLGPLFQECDEIKVLNSARRVTPSSAPNVFQWSLINGLNTIEDISLKIINVLPIGSWPRYSDSFYITNSIWYNNKEKCYQVGSFNIPLLKQLERAEKIKKILQDNSGEIDEVIIYSTYLPFLKAVKNLPETIKISLIVTDLPEYYELTNTSKIKSHIRNIYNQKMYSLFNRIDRFILLTDQMSEVLPIEDKPYIVIEGLYDIQHNSCKKNDNDNVTRILYTGTLRYVYGISNLLDAFKMIDRNDVELHICGSGEAEVEIKELAKVDSRILFHGFCSRDDVRSFQQNADILVNPRPNQGEYTKYSFPSKTMEYMASGKPVVMNRLDGIPDEYEDYLFYAKDSSAESLKSTILYVLNHRDEAEKKANDAKVFIENRKNSKEQARKLIAFIRNN